MIREDVYRKNLRVILVELENEAYDRAKRMIREELWMSEKFEEEQKR